MLQLDFYSLIRPRMQRPQEEKPSTAAHAEKMQLAGDPLDGRDIASGAAACGAAAAAVACPAPLLLSSFPCTIADAVSEQRAWMFDRIVEVALSTRAQTSTTRANAIRRTAALKQAEFARARAGCEQSRQDLLCRCCCCAAAAQKA